MKNLVTLFAVATLAACSKTPPAQLPTDDVCKANIEAAYAKGISDAFGFLTKVRQGGIAKGGGYDISVKGMSTADINSCVACGTALLREGIKLMRSVPAATSVGATTSVAPTSLAPLGQ